MSYIIQGKLADMFQKIQASLSDQKTVVTTLDAIRKALPSPDSVTFNGCEKVTELKDESKIYNDIETGFGGSMQTCRVVTGDLEMGLRLSVYGNNSATAFNSDIDEVDFLSREQYCNMYTQKWVYPELFEVDAMDDDIIIDEGETETRVVNNTEKSDGDIVSEVLNDMLVDIEADLLLSN